MIYFFFNLFTFIFSDAENLHVLVSTRHLGCLTDGMTRPPHSPYPRVLTLPFFGPFFPNLHLKAQHVSCILIFFFKRGINNQCNLWWFDGVSIHFLAPLILHSGFSAAGSHQEENANSRQEACVRQDFSSSVRSCSPPRAASVPLPEVQYWMTTSRDGTDAVPAVPGRFPFHTRSSKCGAPPRWAPLNGRGTRKCVWPFYNVLKRRSPWWPDPGWFI